MVSLLLRNKNIVWSISQCECFIDLTGSPISWSYFSSGTFLPVATAVSLACFFVCFLRLLLIRHNPSLSRTGWRRNKNNEGVKLASPVFFQVVHMNSVESGIHTYSVILVPFVCSSKKFHHPHNLSYATLVCQSISWQEQETLRLITYHSSISTCPLPTTMLVALLSLRPSSTTHRLILVCHGESHEFLTIPKIDMPPHPF